MQFTPYLNFNGQCGEAFRFYEQCFRGKIVMMMTHGETEIANQVPPDWHNLIMHARLLVGDAVLMGSDAPPDQYQEPRGLWVSIHVDDPAEADRVFGELSEGGTVTMQIVQTFWARRFGMLVDRFGTPWMINCE